MSHDPIADRMIDALRRQGARVSLDLADAIRAGVRNARDACPEAIALDLRVVHRPDRTLAATVVPLRDAAAVRAAMERRRAA